MNTFIIMVTGEGAPPNNLKELLPWAKKVASAEFPFESSDKSKSRIVSDTMKVMVGAIYDFNKEGNAK